MAADEHLNTQLFHGTTHPFNPGDIINPTDTEHTEEPMAYATSDLAHAIKVARVRERMHNRRNPNEPATSQIFEVEHMSVPANIWGVKHAADAKGFRVVRRVEQ